MAAARRNVGALEAFPVTELITVSDHARAGSPPAIAIFVRGWNTDR
jgi:hypothetical protein